MSLCNICFDEESTLVTVPIHETNPCINFNCCHQCAYTYLVNKIKEKEVSSASLTCPSGCKESLSSEDVHRLLNHISKDVFIENKTNEFQKTKEDIINLYDIAKNEQNNIEIERNRRLQRILPSFKDITGDIALSCWSIGTDSGRCPGCRTLIEKNGGCQHMTCKKCKHEFWWCCGQDYKKSNHNEVLCFPLVFMNHRHKYWGPNILIRTFTKTTIGTLSIGLGATAASIALVAVPTYLISKQIDEKSGFKNFRIQRRNARHTARRVRNDRERLERQQQRIATSMKENAERIEQINIHRKVDVLNYGFDPQDYHYRYESPSSFNRQYQRRMMVDTTTIQTYPYTQQRTQNLQHGIEWSYSRYIQHRIQFMPVMTELKIIVEHTALEREVNRVLTQPIIV